MFDMNHVGMTIASLRREADMTQMELADRLGISYQAVSSWERGSTMPDIAKLPELAEIFGVSIDKILGHENTIVTKAAEGTLEEHLKAVESVDIQQLEEAAPLLRPGQMERAAEHLTPTARMEDVISLAPFIGRDAMEKLVQSLEERPSLKELAAIAPFFHKSTLSELITQSIETGEVISFDTVVCLAPFVGKDTVGAMLPLVNPKPGFRQITAILPFVHKEVLRDLVSDALEKEKTIPFATVVSFAPFIDREMVELMLHFVHPRPGIRELSSIAPFISRSAREEIIADILGSSRNN